MNIVDMKNQQRQMIEQPAQDVSVGLTTIQGFELAQRAAKLLASSTLVPERYRGNLADCVVALNMAQRMGSDPLMTMQNLYVVHGTPAWSAQMLISVWNQCGRYTSIRYQFDGEQGKDAWGCRAVSMERETKEIIEGALITIGMAKAEGWYGKKGSKWQTMPEQMLRYRAAAWLVRAYAPELAMGFQTVEEVHDVYDAQPGRDGSFSVSDLRDASGLGAAFEETDETAGHGGVDEDDEHPEKWPERKGDKWIDSRGLPFDSRVHGMSAGGVPAVNKHGAYRMKRGCDPTMHSRIEKELIDALNGRTTPDAAQEHNVVSTSEQTSDEAATQSSGQGFSASDVVIAINRCASEDDCNDVDDMLRDADIDADKKIDLLNVLAERRTLFESAE